MWESIRLAVVSWRTLSVVLLSFSSGLPLGLVWIAMPDWMASSGFDIRVVGLVTLAQAPWSFKILWSPLMDRYKVPWLGRRRGWIAVSQIALFALTLLLAGIGHRPDAAWVILAFAFAVAIASASQDIVIDAYAVDVLRKEEQGVAVGLRMALYRGGMLVAGGGAITLAARYSWPLVNLGLALVYLPMLVVTWRAPETEAGVPEPQSLREAIWLPFIGFLSRHRALEILAFVLCYKLADSLSQSLLRPFLYHMGYDGFDRGVSLATVGLAATLFGAFVGGAMTSAWGLGHCLWIFGGLQIGSNLGYILVSKSAVNLWLMYGALGFEMVTSGMGMGAFGVLLLRMTQRRFSATQYALFSSLFALPRLLGGPITGFVVDAVGWTSFFWLTIVAGVPGMILLARFVPLGTREPEFTVEPPRYRERLSTAALTRRGAAAGLVGTVIGTVVWAALDAAKAGRLEPEAGFDFSRSLSAMLHPAVPSDWIVLLGAVVFGLAAAMLVAGVAAVRHGAATDTVDPS